MWGHSNGERLTASRAAGRIEFALNPRCRQQAAAGAEAAAQPDLHASTATGESGIISAGSGVLSSAPDLTGSVSA